MAKRSKDAHGVFLDRYTGDGAVAGDTWHETVEDAHHQARFEYGDGLSAWREIPDGVEDEVAFALANAA